MVNDREIGIDTYHLDEPPDDEPEGDWDDDCDDVEEERKNEIMDELSELIDEFTDLADHAPHIPNYTTARKMNPATGLRACPFACKGGTQDLEQTEIGIRIRCSCGACGPSRQNSLMAKLAWNAD